VERLQVSVEYGRSGRPARERANRRLLKVTARNSGAHTIHIDAFHTYPPMPPAPPASAMKDSKASVRFGIWPEREARRSARPALLPHYGLDVTSDKALRAARAICRLATNGLDYERRRQTPAQPLLRQSDAGPNRRSTQTQETAGPARANSRPQDSDLANAWRADQRNARLKPPNRSRVIQGDGLLPPAGLEKGTYLLAYSRSDMRANLEVPADWPRVKTVRPANVDG